MPRKYGYAPKTNDLYKTESAKNEARGKMFKEIDTDNCGYISLEKWITYATKHIRGKMVGLPKDYLSGENVTKNEFITFIKKAVNKNSAEYQELYFYLLKTFKEGDMHHRGEVDPIAFDKMIEAAAAAPRRHGLAPKTEDMYKTDAVSI